MKNSQNDTEPAGEQMTLFSLAGFLDHANHTHLQESGLGKTIQDISGQKCLEQFEKFDHVGLWAKTFSALLIGQADWFSRRCKLTWNLRGTKSRRMYFQLVPSTLRTEGTEFGLLPTLTAQDFKRRGPNSKQQGLSNTENWVNLLPTPTASDGTMGSIIGENDSFITTKNGTPRKVNQNGQNGSIGLGRFAAMGMLPTVQSRDWKGTSGGHQKDRNLPGVLTALLPTPATRDYKGARTTEALEASGRTETNSLPDAFHQSGKTSQLNPQFVLEMMGFPIDWTELPFLNGETNPSKQQGTQ